MTNTEIARALSRIGTMLEIDGANSFKVRAYNEGARVVENHGEAIAALVDEPGALEALQGIGKSIAQAIRDLVANGHTQVLDDLLKKYPGEVVTFTELQGLGPKRVRTLFDALGLRTRAELEQAAKAGKLRDLPGFGEKVEQNVLKALATASRWTGRMLLADAWPLAHAIADRIRAVKGVQQLELAGSFRRRKDTVGDLDLLVTGGDPEQVMHAFTTHDSVADILGRGDTKSSVKLKVGIQVDLRVVPEASFGAALMYFTGSKEHNIELRKLAIEKGWSLNEYGLTQAERVVAARTEEDVYRALGLAWVPPELREARGEIALARAGRLPKLIEESDLCADLHMHTTRTDGRDSIDDMVKAAKAKGYAYVAITDHSKALAMAFGFDAARVRQSIGEIEAARARHPDIQILHGLEVDILADGELDLDDETLGLLDWVLIAFHSRMDQPADVATARALKAVSNPTVHAFAHPTGRMIGTREPLAFDVERVADAAAARGVAMEINASPERLDLSDVHARLARERGCRFVIDTDAHATGQLDHIRFGVFQARRAGLTKDDVLNTRPFDEFRKSLRVPRAGVKAPAAPPVARANAGPPAAKRSAPAKVAAQDPAPAAKKAGPAAAKTKAGKAAPRKRPVRG